MRREHTPRGGHNGAGMDTTRAVIDRERAPGGVPGDVAGMVRSRR
jgi:hypothetical protein